MNDDDTTTIVDDAQDLADFAGGFEGKTAEKIAARDKPAPAVAPQAEEPKPEYVQVTAKEWDEIKAAAARTASYDQQFSKIFGTIGNVQKLLNERKTESAPAAAAPRKVEVPEAAFADMARDFPELAKQTREALQAALSGITNGADVDFGKIEQKIKEALVVSQSAREVEALEDIYPEWRKIVGAVDITKEQPDPENPFRKWLGTKDATYQARVNGTESAAVISRAIRLFQNETKTPAKPAVTPRSDARAERIKAAVQPRGDGAGAASGGKSDDDEFIAGFNSR